jgi:hypothetical protein
MKTSEATVFMCRRGRKEGIMVGNNGEWKARDKDTKWSNITVVLTSEL